MGVCECVRKGDAGHYSVYITRCGSCTTPVCGWLWLVCTDALEHIVWLAVGLRRSGC